MARNLVSRTFIALLCLGAAPTAHAMYSPTLGCFINRDPGVEPLSGSKPNPVLPHSYRPNIARSFSVGHIAPRPYGGRGYHDGMNLYSSYFVPNGLDPSGLGDVIPEKLDQVVTVGLSDASDGYTTALEALRMTRKMMWDGELPNCDASWSDGPADAFRHCFWMCRLAKKIGVHDAIQVGDVHEAHGNQDANDYINNAYGAGAGSAGNLCKERCLELLQSGTLRYKNKKCPCDPKKFVSSDPGDPQSWN